MNVLVIGRGGREHSIIQKLCQSPQVEKVYAAPGNGGIEEQAERIDIKETDSSQLIHFAKENQVAWTIVGPENPLIDGIVDDFQAAGLKVFGPVKQAALIEGSKHFAKSLMEKYEIPTAAYEVFTEAADAKKYVHEKGAPIVIKADGLAAGKGVVVAETVAAADQAIEDMLIHGQFGNASREIVIEDFLEGEEFSLMAFVNGSQVHAMIPSQDHKRAFNGDEGPNTGGMGAYAPVPFLSEEEVNKAVTTILEPAAKAMVEEGSPFTGILYAGLIQTSEGAKVIEFNARFGDPETQVVLPLLKNDLIQVIADVMEGNDPQLEWRDGYCGGVVVASSGYPGSYDKGAILPELTSTNDTQVVHAGTKRSGGAYVSDGGRVLLVSGRAEALGKALDMVYSKLVAFERYDGFFYRHDIGKSALHK
ncbi:phosphoribosylamine--glycine ligase [Thalassobacillus pellis]|uniref:phosphoribosylamine--glycine ligase n=1 Tax=Thalassobacillus pellis TaxID=748008 RepID=UPI0019607262|nr:phosphoribosylamine--glycine ligase [Thalassobacillus pellis]MBM7553410.1 phosphoribosylamine--glycine ligase [Thalassobacillus pellis]